ncbi:uncharacterized protein LOC135837491 [Planococcus citri]|uniref:uncharacterized protein LOC135837491 n=1 Tax=Planococcus citri TaxID=170843 RepID=UPI0031F8E3B8
MHEDPHPHSVNTPPPVGNVTNEDIKKVFDLLAEGEARLNGTPSVENVTLLMGNTGSGKSTLTQRIAGYDTNLVSVKEGLDFTISKLNNQTKNSYMTSATIFPELVHDNSTGAWYYDFPGFLDTRGMAHDVTTSYFINKVIDNAKRVKILVVVNYTSLTRSGTRDDFTNLLKHVTKFVKNFEQLKDGICLIVTKVPFPEFKDSKIIQNLVESIKAVKEGLKTKANTSDEIKLIDVLLLQQEGVYSKIGISRTPNQAGILSEIPLLKENKRNLTAIIDKLSFVEKTSSDFGYFVPEQSLYDVSKLIKEINEKILEYVEKSGKKLQENIMSQESQIYDLSQLINATSSFHNKLIDLRDTGNLELETKDCVEQLVNEITSKKMEPDKPSLLPAVEYAQYASFLHMASDHVLRDSFVCTEGLKNVIEYSNRSKNWYKFLQQLYNRLLESHSLCTALANHIHEANASSASLLQLLKDCFPNYNYELNDIANITLDEPKLNTLRRILYMALKNDLHHLCEANKLTVKGNHIKLSDVVKRLKNCTTLPHIIEIFALKKLFIDTDLNMIGDEVQLFIIAPIWESWGARKITLDGLPGNPHNSSKATNGTDPDGNGFNGEPGLPGKSGGHFVGIWETFINLPDLSISVNGGQGGPGQDGGDAASGKNGDDAYDDIIETRGTCSVEYNPPPCACNATSSNHTIILDVYKDGNITESGRIYILAGKEGHIGGKGGDGGTGGVDGYPGEATFISLLPHNTTKIHVEMKTGLKGLDGRGGQGGSGGKFGNDLEIWSPCQQLPRKYNLTDNYKQASVGKNGVNGGNSKPVKFPQNKELYSKSHVINHYNEYVRENLNHSIQESHLREFLKKLESNQHISKPRIKRQGPLTIKRMRQKDGFMKSSANMIKSPINTAIRFIGGILGTWKSIYLPYSYSNCNSIKEGVQSWFRGLTPFNVHTTKDFDHHFESASTFNAYESLTLIDFFVRWVTKVRPYDNTFNGSVNSAEVTASVLNIVAEIETLLRDLSIQYNFPTESLEFDPIVLMSALEKEVINGNEVKLAEIMSQTILDIFNNPDDTEFSNHVAHKINAVLGIEKGK